MKPGHRRIQVFVTKDGKALTNAHVVRGCREIGVTMEGQRVAARILATDQKNDLALLATNLHPTRAANWRLKVRQGEDIVVYGFPLTGALSSGGNVTTGNITALAGLADDSRFLQISAPVQPGNSGGPLLDRNGSVVGIVVSKLNALGVASATGDLRTSISPLRLWWRQHFLTHSASIMSTVRRLVRYQRRTLPSVPNHWRVKYFASNKSSGHEWLPLATATEAGFPKSTVFSLIFPVLRP
jgi:trypsin-like peptidase